MYKIYADNTCIYDDTKSYDIVGRRDLYLPSMGFGCIDPNFEWEAGKAGSLTFTLVPRAYGYNEIKKMLSYIRIYRDDSILPYEAPAQVLTLQFNDATITPTQTTDICFIDTTVNPPVTRTIGVGTGGTRHSYGKPYWMGRVIEIAMNNDASQTYRCEGALAFTNDIIIGVDQPRVYPNIFHYEDNKAVWRDCTISQYLADILAEYNRRVDHKRMISLDPNIESIKYTQNGVSKDYLLDIDMELCSLWKHLESFTKNFGGYFYIKYSSSNTSNYYIAGGLAYDRLRYKERPYVSQAVVYGENMLSFSGKDNVENYKTAIVALAGDRSHIMTVSPNHSAGQPGYIEEFVMYDDIKKFEDEAPADATARIFPMLKAAAERDLIRIQNEGRAFEITALNMHLIDPTKAHIDLLDKVELKADIYQVTGIPVYLKKISFNLSDVTSMVYTFNLETEEIN